MTTYRISAPNGKTYEIEGPPGATQEQVIQAVLAQSPEAGQAPETSFLGQVGEAFKGVIPGAVGFVEQAAIGASALLPEEYEKPTRETIAQVAGAAKAPFAPAPGYGDTVGRKFGEAFGSFLPMLPLGALGLAGKTAAVGLGVGAGAGEARTRAETEGATEEQRSTATALGTLPGALEVFAPFRILKRIPEGEVLTAAGRVKRIALASGEEAAQEAASGLAQNMIARGVYKPEQELIEGLGEQAAYGGAVGGLAQGLLDLALGRRARGAGTGEPVPPEGKTAIDIAKDKREAERQAAEAAKAAKEAPPEIPPLPETYAELVRYSEEVKRLPKSKERNEALKAASEKRKALVIDEVNANRLSAERAKQFLTAEEAEQAEIMRREEFVPPTVPTTPTAAPPVEEPTVRKAGAPAPLPDVLDSATIKTIGFTRGKIHDALVGKALTDPEIRAVLEEYKNRANASAKTAAKIDAFLARLPEPTVPTAPTVEPAAPPVAAEPAPEVPEPETPSAVQPDEQPSGAGAPVAGRPAAVAPTEGAGAPEPSRVVPLESDAGQSDAGTPSEPAPVTPSAIAETMAPTPTTYVAPVSQGAAARVKRGVRREAPVLDTEADIDRAEALGEIDAETADRARAELTEFEAPATAMGQAFQKQIDEIKAKMDALRLKGERIPAPKSKARKEFDALQEQLNALLPKETGTLEEKLEKAGATGVFVAGGAGPVLDIPSVRAALKNRSPKMLRAVLAYIGVDTDGTYLPTTYSASEAAELVGLKKGSGSEVTRIADALGVTPDVISRFQAASGPERMAVGAAKNVSEASLSGISVENPKAGVLYEAPKKPAKTEEEYDALVAKEEETRKDFESGKYEEGTKEFDKERKAYKDAEKALKAAQPKAQDFLRPALTKLGQIDFTKLSIGRTKNRETKQYEDGLAEIYARASFYPAENNAEVMKALGAEIEARRKADRKGTDAAVNRAYGKVVEEQEAKAEEEAKTTEEVDEDVETEGKTRRLSDEDAGDDAVYRTIPRLPLIQGVISDAQLRKVVADIERALGGEADITILDDVTDLDNKQAPGSRAGALLGGKIYLFRSGIADGVEGQKTIFHEVFHKGLANLLSPAEYRALMTKFYNQSAAVRQAADAYLASETGKKDTEKLTKEEGRVLAVEEALADMAEATNLTGSTLRQLGNFFARVADRFNMPGLARAIRTMGLDPLQAFIRDVIQAGIKPSTATGRTRYRSLVGEKEERTLGQSLEAKFGGNLALGFRALAMDLLGGIDYIFTKAYGNRIRDNRGNYNPVFLMSRALDAPRFATEVKKYGTMRRDPTGLLSVDTLTYKGQDISYKQVLEDIAAEAKTRDIAPETFFKQVGESLASHREYELMNSPQAAGLDFFLTPQEAATAEQAFQSDAFIKEVSNKLDAIRFAMIDAMVDAGRITPEKAQVWKDAIGYVPFSRIDDFDNLTLPQGGGSNAKLAAFKQIKAYKGSKERQTQNPVENFSKLMDWMVNESMKADAVGSALTEMEMLGYAQFVPSREAIDNNKQGALVDTYVKGQKKTFYVPDPANLAAFVGTPKDKIPTFIRGAQKFSKYLRIGVTATPPFAVKQVFDDITRAYVHSGVKNPAAMLPRILLNFPRNWWNEVKGTESAGVRELAKSGVVPAYDTVIGGNVKNILEETGLAPRSVGRAILRVMEAGAKASDISVREAIYKQTMKETGDKALAELRAREIINFSRRGVSRTADYLIRTIPFFNAYARSMDKLILAAAGNPSAQRSIGATTGYARNLFYKRMGVLTAIGFGYALMMSDDEEYQNQPDYVRDRNWIIPGGKELGFVPAMPIPAELSFFFKAIPERVVQYFKLEGTPEERDGIRVLKELMLNGVDIFSAPNITPQVFKPILENLMNYSFFLGRPLESQAQLALDPSERYGTGTSEAMKAASRTLTDIATSTGIESLEVSPIMLENLVRGMFGMSTGIALSVADVMVNPTRTDRPLHQTIAAQLTGASAVMKDPVGMRYLDEIYNLDRSVEQVYNSYRRKLENNPDDAEKFLKDNFGLYVVRSEVRSTMEAIRALNAQARAIDKMTDLSPQERRVLINDLRAQQNDLARDVYRLRRQVTEEQRMMDASR